MGAMMEWVGERERKGKREIRVREKKKREATWWALVRRAHTAGQSDVRVSVRDGVVCVCVRAQGGLDEWPWRGSLNWCVFVWGWGTLWWAYRNPVIGIITAAPETTAGGIPNIDIGLM